MLNIRLKDKSTWLKFFGKLPKGYSVVDRGNVISFNTPIGETMGVLVFDSKGDFDSLYTDNIVDKVILKAIYNFVVKAAEIDDVASYVEGKPLNKKNYIDTLGFTKEKEYPSYEFATYSYGALRVAYGVLVIIYNTDYFVDLFFNFAQAYGEALPNVSEKELKTELDRPKKTKLNLVEAKNE